MTAVTQLSALPLVHALGWTLLHFIWQGVIVALLLACLLGLLPLRASRLRYAAACTAMALMLALPLITFAVLVAHAQPESARLTFAAPSNGAVLAPDGDLQPSAQPWNIRCEKALNQALPAVIAFWLAGVLLLLCRLNLGLVATRKMRSHAVEPAAAELEKMLQPLRLRLGIERTIQLLHSARVQAPTVIGWLRPVILIPLGCVTGLSTAQIEAILAHELAHIRRHDYLVNLVQSVIETVLFYHPAVWWVSSRIRREREHCCDDLAVAICGDRLAYARALSSLEERRRPAPAGAFAANGGALKTRIARVLGVSQAAVFPRTAAVILLLLAGAAAGLAALGAARAQSATSAPGSSSQTRADAELPHPYAQWLNQDVRWIIAPREKQAFLRLGNDQERDAFIEQFWAIRNPTPGSPVNPFRQEHYRRIAYANAHFAVKGEPGWATDRGHVYIVFGPPDSIDSHPSSGGGSAKPFETWHYRSVKIQVPAVKNQNGSGYETRPAITRTDVDFRFVDDCGCGEYQLRSPWPSATAAEGLKNPPSAVGNAGPAIQILSNTGNVDFRGWLIDWRQATNRTFQSLAPGEPGAPNRRGALIRFKVLPDGRIMDSSVVLERTSGDAAIDRAAWDAVVRSVYPPLPGSFVGPYLELRAIISDPGPAEQSSAAPGDPTQHRLQQPSNPRIQVRKLTIVSADLPAAERLAVVQAFQGHSYSAADLAPLIRQQLRNRGYLTSRVEVQNLSRLQAAPPDRPIDVSATISAGAQYTFAGVVVTGAHLFSQKQIQQQFPIHPGDVFNAAAIAEGLDRLKKLYGAKEYDHFGAIVGLRTDDARHTAALVLNIEEGKPNPA